MERASSARSSLAKLEADAEAQTLEAAKADYNSRTPITPENEAMFRHMAELQDLDPDGHALGPS